MKTSQNGKNKITQWEGVRYEAYKDQAGVITIGIGHTSPSLRMGDTCTEEQAKEWLVQDLHTAENAINSLVKVPLSQSQFDALVSFVFNVGVTAFKNSTLLRKLNAGDYDAVPGELAKWNKITVGGKKVSNRGLSNRRAAEAGLWASGEFVASAFVAPAAPERKPMKRSHTAQGIGVTGVATMGTAATEAAQQVSMFADYSDTLRYMFVGLLFVGLGLTAYGYWKRYQREEE